MTTPMQASSILAEAETTRTYAYDSAGRLTGDGITTWAYDANGNRTKINGVTVATFDTQDRRASLRSKTRGNEYSTNACRLVCRIDAGSSSSTLGANDDQRCTVLMLIGHGVAWSSIQREGLV